MKNAICDIFNTVVSIGCGHVKSNPPRALVGILLRAIFGTAVLTMVTIGLLYVGITSLVAIFEFFLPWNPSNSTQYYLRTWFHQTVWKGDLEYMVMIVSAIWLSECMAKRRLF